MSLSAMPSTPAPLTPAPANAPVRLLETTELAQDWTRLSKTRFELRARDQRLLVTTREIYHLGDGAAVLLYHPRRGTVLLTRQFRLPAFLTGCADGLLIETCAGLLDGEDPADCVRREAQEEVGLRVQRPQAVFQAYMSPGSVTQKLHCFCAEYEDGPLPAGGGLADEGEDIEVLEMPLREALASVYDGRIQDGKTIMLLLHAALVGLEGLSAQRLPTLADPAPATQPTPVVAPAG